MLEIIIRCRSRLRFANGQTLCIPVDIAHSIMHIRGTGIKYIISSIVNPEDIADVVAIFSSIQCQVQGHYWYNARTFQTRLLRYAAGKLEFRHRRALPGQIANVNWREREELARPFWNAVRICAEEYRHDPTPDEDGRTNPPVLNRCWAWWKISLSRRRYLIFFYSSSLVAVQRGCSNNLHYKLHTTKSQDSYYKYILVQQFYFS